MAAYAVLVIDWLILFHGLIDRAGNPLGADFVTFFAAARLAAAGHPAQVYDVAALHGVERAAVAPSVAPYAWHYPPTFLLAVTPLAALPYLLAVLCWTALGLLAYYAWVRRADGRPIVTGLALGFPGRFLCVAQGQNGVLSLLLLSGLWLVPARPLLAGAVLGLLTYKPQLVPIVVVTLLTGRRWRALAGMGASAGAWVGLTLRGRSGCSGPAWRSPGWLRGPSPWRPSSRSAGWRGVARPGRSSRRLPSSARSSRRPSPSSTTRSCSRCRCWRSASGRRREDGGRASSSCSCSGGWRRPSPTSRAPWPARRWGRSCTRRCSTRCSGAVGTGQFDQRQGLVAAPPKGRPGLATRVARPVCGSMV